MITIKQVLSVCVIIWCLVVNPIKSQWDHIYEEECRTSNRNTGTCINIRECKPMIDYLQSISSKSQKVIEILRGYECGYEGNYVKVCCPDGPLPEHETSNPSTNTVNNGNNENNGNNGNAMPHPNLNLLSQDCGPLPGINRIIGGSRTSLFEFPWMALLQYETARGPDYRCGGSVLNERYILTAAHCITNLSNLRLIAVRCGEYNISSPIDCERDGSGDATDTETCAPPVQDMEIEETIPHPDYNPSTYSNDIGLIRLTAPLNLSVESVKPICLPTESSLQNLNFTSTNLIVTGWGTTEEGRRSADLLKVELSVVSPQRCRTAYENTSAIISDRQICAGGHNRRDSCGGDSGGPLQRIDAAFNDARFVQYGIVSFGIRRCGQEGFPGVYTRTDSYLNWILDNLKP